MQTWPRRRIYESVSKSFRTESITKSRTTTKTPVEKQHKGLWRQNSLDLTHKIAIQLQVAAESSTICSSLLRRLVRKLLDTLSHLQQV
jgi:hypothetical protein